jgi:ferredoxin-NADP reductase
MNKYSMYKVVSGALTILFVIALALSLAGAISYSPLAMIASLLVLGFSVWLTSLLFGLLLGVRVHTESSFITAVILFFIFTPTLEIAGLTTLLLVGIIAGASKFLLTYKGRHIFNPVAIAAFIIGLTGIGYASWWVATPVLVLPVLLLGYVILQKTRRFALAGTFLGVASVLVIGLLVSQGATLGEGLVLWLSWPILFFAIFMLTEPLTLPGKKWQCVAEAIVVAVLFAIPFHIGEFSSSPAFALVVGNLVALVFARRSRISLTLNKQVTLTPTTEEFVFIPSRSLRFEAGQYLELTLPHKKDDLRGSRRSFSITSAPGEAVITLGVKFYQPSSSFKTALRSLKDGAVLEATGVSGDFTLPKDGSKPLLFVAGGIGITPFMSHLQSLALNGEKRDLTLLYSINTIDELAYRERLIESGIKVYIVTKSDKPLKLPEGWTHINEPYLTKESIAEYVSDVDGRKAYISGPPVMIDAVKKHLRALHVRRIKTDYFIGY